MNKKTIKMLLAMMTSLALGCAARAGTLNFDSVDPIKNYDGSLLEIGTYATVGHFGNRDASAVAALFSGKTSSADVGSVLSNHYFAIHAPVQTTHAGLLSYSEDVNDNLGSSRNMYAVLAKPVGGIYEIGIFAAYDFLYVSDGYDGGAFVPDTQIKFDNSWPYLNFFTLTNVFDLQDAGFSGATPVAGFGSSSPGSFSLSNVTSTVVPEPSSASLMLLGAAGVLALRRLRKNNV
jgi:hypothetical protein